EARPCTASRRRRRGSGEESLSKWRQFSFGAWTQFSCDRSGLSTLRRRFVVIPAFYIIMRYASHLPRLVQRLARRSSLRPLINRTSMSNRTQLEEVSAMKKVGKLGILTFLMVCIFSPGIAQQDEVKIKIDTELINLDVIVTDRAGKRIYDLKKEDF